MDILFVIDDSGSMEQERVNLTSNFSDFVAGLDSYEPGNGSTLKYRIGVTTTSVNKDYMEFILPGYPSMPGNQDSSWPDGKLVGQSQCALSSPWIDGPDGDVVTSFECAANVGISGSGTEMPFAAM